jgi:hypothetical protein
VDLNTGKVFSVVSNDYRLIKHEEAIEMVEGILHKTPSMAGYVVTTDFYNDGGRMRRKYRFPGITVQVREGDSINLEFHLYNSYDISWPFIVLLGAFRLVCANGLVIGKRYYHFRKRHVFRLEDVGLEVDLDRSIGQFNLQAKEWRKWAEIPMRMAVYDRVMRSMQFGTRAEGEIEEKIWEGIGASQAGVPLISVWTFYNVLTWYITHRVASLNRRVNFEHRLRIAQQFLKTTKS